MVWVYINTKDTKMSDGGKFYGIYRGVVLDRSDPEGRYRLRVKVPQVTGEASTGWVWPCLPVTFYEEPRAHTDHDSHSHGFIDPSSGSPGTTYGVTLSAHSPHTHELPRDTKFPLVGSGVWIMYEAGDTRNPVWMGVF